VNGKRAKEVAREVHLQHREGGCVVPLEGGPFPEDAAAVVILGEVHEIPGPEVPQKEIKRFLWERRGSRGLTRKRAVIVTVQRDESSLIMVGALIGIRTAAYLGGRLPMAELEEKDAS
jgi:hypothetical protein